MAERQNLEIDFASEDFQRNYKRYYEQMHAKCPVVHAAQGDFYAVAKYSDLMSVILNPKLWSSKFGPGLSYQSPAAPGALVNVDPPEHTAEVKIVAKAFTRLYFESLEPEIQEFVDRQLDAVYAQGKADLHQILSIPLPLFVICKMLGIEYEGKAQLFDEWVTNSAAGVLMTPDDPRRADIERSTLALHGYFKTVLEEWQQKLADGKAGPEDNLITRLLTATADGKSLPPHKILGFCIFLLVAGSRTTTILISNLVHRLLNEPAQLAKVKAAADYVPRAIEECLRVDAPVHGLFRTNNEETKLGPYDVQKDTKVMLLWAAANLDPEMWADPNKFDLDRDPEQVKKHVAFGSGIHICRGAPLARLEATVALRRVLAKLPNLRPAGEAVPETRMPVLMGLRSLPVAWDVN